MMKFKEIAIGVDQSYADSGITIMCDNVPLKILGVEGTKDKGLYQKRFRDELQKQINILNCNCEYDNLVLICERIRLYSRGMISLPAMLSGGGLLACMIDIAYENSLPLYSADTSAWKACVVGSNKKKDNPYKIDKAKWLTIEYVIAQGYEKDIIKPVSNSSKRIVGVGKNGIPFTYNDNKADSFCISRFWFECKDEKLLKKEY